MSSNIAHIGFGNKEFLKRCKGLESSNDILGGGHEPGELIRIPLDRTRGINMATFIGNTGDLGDVEFAQTFLNGQSMPYRSVSTEVLVAKRQILHTLLNQ